MAKGIIGSGVLAGVKENLQKRIGIFRRINQNPKADTNNLEQMTPEERAIAVAKGAYGTPLQDSTRKSLEIGLEKAESDYEANPTDELKKIVEDTKEIIRIFDKTIAKIKEEEELENIGELHTIFTKIELAERQVNECVENFDKYVAKLMETLEQDAIENVSVVMQTVIGEYKNYESNLRILNNHVTEYNEKSDEADYVPKCKKINLTNEQVENIYRNIQIKLNELSKKKVVFYRKKYIKIAENMIDLLPNCLENAEDFKTIKEKVDKELASQNISPVEAAKAEAQEKINKLLEQLFEQYKNEFRENKITVTSLLIKEKVSEIVSGYDILSNEQKQELIDKADLDFKAKITNEYDESLLNVVEKANEIIAVIGQLAKVEYTDPQFKTKYDAVIKLIKDTKESELFKKAKAYLIYNEAEQTAHFIFPSDKIDDIKIDVVPENVKAQMKAAPQPKVVNKKEIEDKIAKKLAEIFEEYKAEVKTLNIKVDKVRIITEVGNIIDDYDLTQDEKESYLRNSLNEFNNKVTAEYGNDLASVIQEAISLKNEIADLAKVEYTDPQFKTKYDAVIKLIKDTKESELFKKAKAYLIYNEAEQTVQFIFPSDKIDDIKIDVVPENVKAQMKSGAPAPQPQPAPQPAPKPNPNPAPAPAPAPAAPAADDEERQKAIAAYIALLDELNATIIEINKCNKSIEGAASITFDNVSDDQINTVVNMEKAAMSFDSSIIDKKLELSNARANIRLKYNCYVSSIKEVAEYNMSKIEFSKDYQEFITYYDEMIVIAEKQIIALDNERHADYTPTSRYEELTNKIKNLVNYIEAVNSLINRRIVAESIENGLDIVAVLKQRRENKKEIRKKIEDILNKKAADEPKVNQAEAEAELRKNLNAIYAEWLEQIEYSLKTPTVVVDDESFENRIKETVENSKADKKYQIAEQLKNDFIKNKSDLIERQKDINYRLEIMRVFEEVTLSTIIKIRKDINYKANFDAICIDEETQDKLVKITEASDAQNKNSILEEEKTKYKERIREIVKIEQIDAIIDLNNDIAAKLAAIATYSIDENLEEKIKNAFEIIKIKHETVFTRIEIKYELDQNRITVKYPHKVYNGKTFGNEITTLELKAMSLEMYDKYMEYKKPKPVVPPTDPKPGEPEPGAPQIEDTNITLPIYKVDNGKKLNLKVAKPVINKENSRVLTADTVQLTLIKNGLKIKYSQELRRQLQELNAKLILVKKGESKVKATTKIKEAKEEDVVTIKRKMDEFNIEDYKVQIRADKFDEEGNKLRGTNLIFEMDMGEEIGEVIREGRSL